jgi:hypothetical protein
MMDVKVLHHSKFDIRCSIFKYFKAYFESVIQRLTVL